MISKKELASRFVNACENVIAAEGELTEIDSKNTLATIDFDKQEVEGKPVKVG